MKNTIFHNILKTIFDCIPRLFSKPKYVWFPAHLLGHVIPDPSGQLAELIVYITSTRVDLYRHQILLVSIDWGNVLWPDIASSCYLSQCWQIVFTFHQRVSAAFVWWSLVQNCGNSIVNP